MTELLLGVDIGTSSSKAILSTPEGDEVAAARREHEVSRPHPGWAEQDAESVWWGDLLSLCSELPEEARASVAAIGVSGMSPCVLPTDGSARPLRPGILYGVDTRAGREIDELAERYDSSEVLDRCGSALSSQAVGPKLLWLARNEPEVWERTRRFYMPASFLVHRLTGEYTLDHVSASQSVPLYDLARQRWIQEWWSDLAPGLEPPQLCRPTEVAGQLTERAAEATGLPAGIRVAAGTADTRAEAAGVGVIDRGDALLMYGSTLFMLEVTEAARPHPKLWTTASFEPELFGLTAGMATAGALTNWFRELTGTEAFEPLFDEAEEVAAGSEGLVVLPYFSGERTPLFDPKARGAILGLTLSHSRGHLYRALLEATAYGVRHNLEAMAEAGGRAREFTVVGGGARGRLWTQIVSDVCGIDQVLPRETAGASYGDAWIGGLAAGLVDRAARWNVPVGRIEPDERPRAVYDRLYEIYRDLYPLTAAHAHDLADLQ
ncbi:MAG: FGGY-family carbohydrate kinase, partial [Actinomycetota bacterium]